jgi:two-component system CheB/CheR fusion protein
MVKEYRFIVRESQATISLGAPLDKTRARFLSVASHDLRQPFQALSIVNEVMHRRVGPELRELVSRQDAALWSMRTLLECFLDLDRIACGAIAPVLCDFVVQEVLSGLGESMRDQCARRSVRLSIGPSSLIAHSDPLIVRRIAQALVAIAIEYAGAKRIVVGLRRGRACLRLEVWDTGAAIAAQQRVEVLCDTHAEQGSAPGYGLGLLLVRRLADLLGAGLEVRAKPGGAIMTGIVLARAKAGCGRDVWFG